MNNKYHTYLLMAFGFCAAVLLFSPKAGPAAAQSPEDGGHPFLIENAGQFKTEVRYRGMINGGVVWLTDDAIWLSYAGEDGEAQAGVHVRIGFGLPLSWEPFAPQRTVVRYIGGGRGAETLTPHAWGGVHAYPGPGVVLTVTGAGIEVSGPGTADLSLQVEGGRLETGAASLQLDGRPLPLSWSGSILVNGLQVTGSNKKPIAPDTVTDPQLLFSTYIGGGLWDEAEGIGRDSQGNSYIGGQTLSPVFPTTPGPFTAPLHAVESYVARLNWNGSSLDYINVYLGDVEDWGTALAVDPAGNAYLAGRTDSTDYPTTPGAYGTSPIGLFDGFVMKFDPQGALVFSTLIGGGEDDYLTGIAVDGAGAVYITGGTFSDGVSSAAFPITPDAYERVPNGGRDVFLSILSSEGSALIYSTYLGGSGSDQAEALALSAGAVVLVGCTASGDFDVPAGGFDTTLNGAVDPFVVRLVPGNAALDFWTFLGGNDPASCDRESAQDVAVDPSGKVYVVGRTAGADFPVTAGALDPVFGGGDCAGSPCTDAFAAELSTNGSTLLWATFLGGTGEDSAESIEFDASGEPVIGGVTASADFPVTGDAFDPSLDGASDAFVLRLAASGDTLLYGTFLGGSLSEKANALAVSPGGWIYVTGWTDSLDFPTTPLAFDPGPNFPADKEVFVTVLIPPGSPDLKQIFLPFTQK